LESQSKKPLRFGEFRVGLRRRLGRKQKILDPHLFRMRHPPTATFRGDLSQVEVEFGGSTLVEVKIFEPAEKLRESNPLTQLPDWDP